MSDSKISHMEPEVDDRLLAFADRLRDSGQEEVEEERPDIWVSFHLAERLYALPVTHVREYTPVSKITRVPGAPSVVCGVASHRGHAIPVVDLKKVLGLSDHAENDDCFVLVAEQRGRLIGLLIDRIDRVLKLLPSKIKIAPSIDRNGATGRILGSYELEDQSLILLAAETFLSRESSSGS